MSSTAANRFRFRPRFRGLAVLAIAAGAAVLAVAFAVDTGRWITLACGGGGMLLGLLYLSSPTWRIEVVTDDQGFEVVSGKNTRFRLLWAEVEQVIASPSTRTCFVAGDSPARSLLIPGPGASAPYDIVDKDELYRIICERVPAERVREVELLEHEIRAGSRSVTPDRDNAGDSSDDDGPSQKDPGSEPEAPGRSNAADQRSARSDRGSGGPDDPAETA